ncbi:SPFH domain-containing protein [Frisingicoccus sp.]|uniref:SPFH domain-containing protein n=1 Tax=Frisingicoccus sp. TaxID=1918627 RepID=UPI003AB40BA3
MGLGKLIRGQTLSSISYRAAEAWELAQLFDREGRRIMYESVLTVQPGQEAVLVNEGTLADIFRPGRYELTTENMPVVTALKEWKYGFDETFIVETVFVNTNDIIDIPWGTSGKLTLPDNTFGMVNLGANGKYSFAITDSAAFIHKLMGTKNRYTVEDLKDFLTSHISMMFKEIITEQPMNFFDIQGYCGEAAQALKMKLGGFLADYGITVKAMNLQIALPEAVMKAIDERAVMGAMGGMEAYAFKKQVDAQTEAMVSMAKNPGGGMNSVAGMGMQMAAGMTMAGQMGNMMGGMIQPQGGQQIPNGMAQQTAAPAAGGHRFCSQCGSPVSPNDKFCSNCGAKL